MSLTAATVIFLSVALGLQVVAGLLAILYRDLNPARQVPRDLERILKAPRAVPLSLHIPEESTEDPKGKAMREAYEKASAESRGHRWEFIEAGLLPALNPEPGDSRSPLAVWWSREAAVSAEYPQESSSSVRILSSPWQPWNFHDWEIDAIRNGLRYGSYVLVGVIAIIRIAHGEPLLRLF